MALIPDTAGISMRMLTDHALHPVTPVTEIPSDLMDLIPGKVFSARIQEVLPENTYKALVAGHSLTLSLAAGAKAGDTLELVVIDRTPRTVVAQLANQSGAETSGESQEFTTLSQTARLIGNLLARDGESPAPAALNRGQPLLARAPLSAAEILPQLTKAISQSGLFYEAHQVQWALGQRPLADLLAEPQGAYSKPDTLAAYRQTPLADSTSQRAASANLLVGGEPSGSTSILQSLFGADTPETRTPGTPALPTPLTNPSAATVPDELRPLVQQQLEAASTQRMAWHGELLPDQPLEWEIEREVPHPSSRDDEPPGWTTTLRLATPQLGQIDAELRLTSQGIQINIAAASDTTASGLRQAAGALQQALTTAGVSLLALHIKNETRG
jgi:hypothetical protein